MLIGDLIFFSILAYLVVLGFVVLVFRLFRRKDAQANHPPNPFDSNVSISIDDDGKRKRFDDVGEYLKLPGDSSRLPCHIHLSDSDGI